MRDIFDDESDEQGTNDFASMFEDSLKGVGRSLSVGDKIRGEILSIGKEELFVSTGTINDGTVLKTELVDANGQFNHKVGDFLDLYVTRVQGAQIMLSPKPTAKNMADDLEDAFDMMLPVEGRVTETCNGGFRVSVMGKTAFCPISQMDLRRIDDPQSYIGRKFEFMITQFSEKGRNIVVSRRRLLEEQKELSQSAFIEDNKPGTILKGAITRLEKFGAFVEVAPGVEGLVHISEISWTRISDPAEFLRVGQTVDVKILKVEEVNGRLNISLSIKQGGGELATDPWTMVPQKYPVGTVLKGKVERREVYGLFVRLEEGITALLPKSKAMENPGFAYDKVKVGEEITVQIAELRVAERRISLGVPQDPDAEAWRGFAPSSGSTGKSLGTLGEQFKGLFDSNVNKKK